MKNYYIILFALVGLLGIFTGCEKDGDEAVMSDDVVAPAITSMPDLTLVRANGANDVTFICSAVDPGFNASATYYLEACPNGDNFENTVEIYNGVTCDDITLTVSELNALLLDQFTEDVTSSADIRLRCVLEAEAGFGVEDYEYTSSTYTVDVTIYGLLRLDVIVTGATDTPQKIVSQASDGTYEGYVKFEAGDSFTLLDPDNNITYGASGEVLSVDGSAITVADAGWYKLTADTEGLTFGSLKYLVGIVGTVNGWAAPDIAMDYDSEGKFWYSYGVELPDGDIKFRHNESWSEDFNFGVEDSSIDLDFSDLSLYNDSGSSNITLTAGTYDIKLWIDLTTATSSSCSIIASE